MLVRVRGNFSGTSCLCSVCDVATSMVFTC